MVEVFLVPAQHQVYLHSHFGPSASLSLLELLESSLISTAILSLSFSYLLRCFPIISLPDMSINKTTNTKFFALQIYFSLSQAYLYLYNNLTHLGDFWCMDTTTYFSFFFSTMQLALVFPLWCVIMRWHRGNVFNQLQKLIALSGLHVSQNTLSLSLSSVHNSDVSGVPVSCHSITLNNLT